MLTHIKSRSRKYSNQVFLVMAATNKQLQQVFLSEFRQQIPVTDYKYNQQQGVIYLNTNGAKLVLMYARDKFEAEVILRGWSVSGIYFIQAETIPKGVRDQALLRMRLFSTPDNPTHPTHTIIYDLNPDHPQHYIYREFLSPSLKADTVVDIRGWTWLRRKGVSAISLATTEHTTLLTPSALQKLKDSLDPVTYQRMILGEWGAAEGAIFTDYTILDHKPTEREVLHYWIGIDPGTASLIPNLAAVWIAQLTDGSFCVIDESLSNFTTLEALRDQLEETSDLWGGPAKFKCVVKDWAGGSGVVFEQWFQEARYDPYTQRYGGVNSYLYNWHVPATNRAKWNPVNSGITLLSQALASEMLTISPHLTTLKQDFARYAWKAGIAGKPDKNYYDPHRIDALRYAWIRIANYHLPNDHFTDPFGDED
jgi:hypothetical protein